MTPPRLARWMLGRILPAGPEGDTIRGDLLESVRRIQAHGIQVQAGMIVGFDHDDESIFEEQLRFIQDAQIPVSMTGMLQAMPRTPLYEGYRWLVHQLYDFRRYRRRTLDYLLHRGPQVHGGRNIRSGDVLRLGRVLRETLWRGGPRRAWFTLSLLGATLLRRPSVFKEAVSFAIVHKAFHDYVQSLLAELDARVLELPEPR